MSNGSGGSLLGRRIASLALDRLPLPQAVKALLRRATTATRRAEQRLQTKEPPVRRAAGVAFFVVTLAAPFGVGYLITNSGGSSTSRVQPPATTTTTVPPTTTTTEAPSPLTRLAGSCATVPTGSVAPFLVVGKVGGGTAPDPRTSVSSRWVGIGFSQSLGATLQSAAPYSVTAVLLPTGATAPTKGVPIDRAGTVQLWIFWDGSAFHKGIRTWDGTAWHMAAEPDPASNALTIQVQLTGAAFFWSGLQPGERYGFVTADAGGCSSAALGANLTPIETVPA